MNKKAMSYEINCKFSPKYILPHSSPRIYTETAFFMPVLGEWELHNICVTDVHEKGSIAIYTNKHNKSKPTKNTPMVFLYNV